MTSSIAGVVVVGVVLDVDDRLQRLQLLQEFEGGARALKLDEDAVVLHRRLALSIGRPMLRRKAAIFRSPVVACTAYPIAGARRAERSCRPPGSKLTSVRRATRGRRDCEIRLRASSASRAPSATPTWSRGKAQGSSLIWIERSRRVSWSG